MVLLSVSPGEPNISGLILFTKNQPVCHLLLRSTKLQTKLYVMPLKYNMNSAAFCFFCQSCIVKQWQLIPNHIDICHVTRYNAAVIKSFADKHTQELYVAHKSKRLQPDLLRRAVRRLEYIDLATCLDDLKVPPSNRLHALKGDREGQYTISINDQWRTALSG